MRFASFAMESATLFAGGAGRSGKYQEEMTAAAEALIGHSHGHRHQHHQEHAYGFGYGHTNSQRKTSSNAMRVSTDMDSHSLDERRNPSMPITIE